MLWRYRPALAIPELLRALPQAAPESSLLLTRSASQAIVMALDSVAGCPGAVALPGYTCLRVVQAVLAAGRRPHFVDISPSSGLMDEAKLKLPQEGLVAVIGTHLFGLPCDVSNLRALVGGEVLLIEDCALAQGSLVNGVPVGTSGDAAVFSYGIGKNVQLGMGGALRWNAKRPEPVSEPASSGRSALGVMLQLTRGASPFQQMQMRLLTGLRALGVSALPTQASAEPLDEMPLSGSERGLLQRALAVAVMADDRETRRRNTFAALSAELIHGLPQLQQLASPLADVMPCSPGLAIRVRHRKAVVDALMKGGVDPIRFYWYSAAQVCNELQCPESVRLAAEILVLPTHEGVGASARARMLEILRHCDQRGWL